MQAARKYNVENKMRNAGMQGQAIQGELIGPGIQGNQYECTELEFFVFDIYDTVRGEYLLPDEVVVNAADFRIPHVPVLSRLAAIPETIEKLLEYAEGKSQLNNSTREGLVFKSLTHSDVSFKVISNKWLLKYE
jgi:ATP-dependent RNA circularization protein (DNA/RNA ligase family)